MTSFTPFPLPLQNLPILFSYFTASICTALCLPRVLDPSTPILYFQLELINIRLQMPKFFLLIVSSIEVTKGSYIILIKNIRKRPNWNRKKERTSIFHGASARGVVVTFPVLNLCYFKLFYLLSPRVHKKLFLANIGLMGIQLTMLTQYY